jgi:thiosulfate dehydrogenase [quinone] large subunit
MEKRIVLRIAAAVAAVVGGYLLYLSANPDSPPGVAFPAFAAGLLLFMAIAWFLMHTYRPGAEVPSEDEINLREWRFWRFLRYGKAAAPFYLGLRLFLGWEWIDAGWHKVTNPAWTGTGAALRSYWERVVAVPAPPAQPAITYPAYRSFIQFMLDNDWAPWFAKLVAWGEVLIGLGLLFGTLVGFAALFGLLMNFAFLYAGSASSNPTLVILEVLVILGWRVAGWWGLDRFLLPLLGTPWAPGRSATYGQDVAEAEPEPVEEPVRPGQRSR